MGNLRNIAMLVLGISFLTFVAFFGRLPIFRNTPIGWLYRVTWIHIPKALRRLDLALTGGRLSTRLSRTIDYLWNDRHPVVLIFFLGLITGSAALFLPAVWSELSTIHHIILPILLPLPYLFAYLCTTSTTQYITPSNHAAQLRLFPYDHILFHAGQECRTCHFDKPARSKHCSICKSCISRSDHHCVWVNACLGRGNYKYFLLLLTFSTTLVAYGAWLAWLVLNPLIQTHATLFPEYHAAQQTVEWGNSIPLFLVGFLNSFVRGLDWLATGLMIGGISVAGVGLLALMTWPLPLGLLGYHVYLIWAGMTTNESCKWGDWREDMHDGYAFIAPVAPEKDETEAARSSPWPVRSKQVVLRTNDGQMPRLLPKVVKDLVDEDVVWERCWRRQQVENLYDLGFWDNLMEVLVN